MMFGSREAFAYVLCGDCGTLQIVDIPDDLGRFYLGATYYSFNNPQRDTGWKLAAKRWAAGRMVGRPERRPHGIGPFARIARGAEPWIASIPGLARDHRILDVGCGEGARLASLAELGFTRLSGVDPYLSAELVKRPAAGIELFRGQIDVARGSFDLVMFHHSLEHLPDPAAALRSARGALSPRGKIIVRLPVLQQAIWKRYGANWAQIDVPRRSYLFTVPAFVNMAQKVGLDLIAYGFDMVGWSLARSEGYIRDISMCQPDGNPTELPPDIAAADWEREAEALNALGEGDQAWFVLKPARRMGGVLPT